MEEQKLTEQVLTDTEQSQTAPAVEPAPVPDNQEMAEHLITSLVQPFSESLVKLGNNELRKLIRLLVQFPFIDVKKFKLNDNQKRSFMLGERLIYANMVKRARAELERTFGEVEKEEQAKTEVSEQTNSQETVNEQA